MSKDIDLNNNNLGFEDFEMSEARPGPKSGAQTPSKPSERKKGSSKKQTRKCRKRWCCHQLFSQSGSSPQKQSKRTQQKHPTKKVSLSQLKKVYRRGAGAFSQSHRPGQTRGSWAMARVNMFLKMKRGGKVKDSYREADKDVTATTYELEFMSYSDVSVSSEFDLTENIFPDDEDFAQAKQDIDEYELDYDFQDVEELYLDDYKPVGFIWNE